MVHTVNRKSKYRLSVFLLLVLLGIPSVSAVTNPNTIVVGPEQTQTSTWESLETDYPEATYRDVEFINASHGWVVGISNSSTSMGGIILYTEDSGNSWETQLLDDNQLFRQIEVIDSKTAWVTGLGRLFFTIDAGKSWESSVVAGGLSGMSTVEFLNETYGLTATMRVLYRTTDGGQTWQPVSGWNVDDNPRDIQFLTDRNVCAIGFNGIYHSEDGTETWEMVFEEGGWSLSLLDLNNGWAVSDDGLFHLSANDTWEKRIVPGRLPASRLQPPYSTDIQFIDSQNGWIVGKEIPVMHTSDGGVTWYEQTGAYGHSSRLMAVHFIDEVHGWTVGYDGCILRTSSGNNLDTILLSGEEILFPIIIGLIAVVIVVPLTVVTIHRKRRIVNESYRGLEPE